MGNKYNSNIRTLVAKNLVWDATYDYGAGALGGAAPKGLFTMSAPTAFSFKNSDCVEQPFNGQWGNIGERSPTGWLKTGNISIKSVGVFCNFADGLVFNDIASRINISIFAYTFSVSATQAANLTGIDYKSNLLSAANIDNLLSDPLTGYPTFIMDQFDADYANLYTLADVNEAFTEGRLSDYAYWDVDYLPALKKIDILSQSKLSPVVIPTLNTMFPQELFLQSSIPSGLTGDDVQFVVLTAKMSVYPDNGGAEDAEFSFYTDVVDTGFNDKPVTFDAVVEVEVTPTNLADIPPT